MMKSSWSEIQSILRLTHHHPPCLKSSKYAIFPSSLNIFQYFPNMSFHFRVHHASSHFTPAPRTVTSVAMALAEVTGDLWFLWYCQDVRLNLSWENMRISTRHKAFVNYGAKCAHVYLFNQKPSSCFLDLRTWFSTDNRLRMRPFATSSDAYFATSKIKLREWQWIKQPVTVHQLTPTSRPFTSPSRQILYKRFFWINQPASD